MIWWNRPKISYDSDRVKKECVIHEVLFACKSVARLHRHLKCLMGLLFTQNQVSEQLVPRTPSDPSAIWKKSPCLLSCELTAGTQKQVSWKDNLSTRNTCCFSCSKNLSQGLFLLQNPIKIDQRNSPTMSMIHLFKMGILIVSGRQQPDKNDHAGTTNFREGETVKPSPHHPMAPGLLSSVAWP